MLTDEEANRIFLWEPYRENWTVTRNRDSINAYYGEFINDLNKSLLFDTYNSKDEGLSNYLEFICFPKGFRIYEGNAIIICVSLCAPISAYGQTSFIKYGSSTFSYDGLFTADKIGDITDISLASIENEVKSILLRHNLLLLTKEFVSRQLPDEIVKALKNENHNEGDQYLNGVFQTTD